MNLSALLQIERVKLNRRWNLVLALIYLVIVLGRSIGSVIFSPSDLMVKGLFFFQMQQGINTAGPTFLGIFFLYNMANERTSGVLRKNVMDGMTVPDHLFGKGVLLVGLAFSLLAFDLIQILSIMGGYLHFFAGMDWGSLLEPFHPEFLLRTLGWLLYAPLVGIFLSAIIKNPTFSVILFVLLGTLEEIAGQLGQFAFNTDISAYLPYGAFDQALKADGVTLSETSLVGLYLVFMMGVTFWTYYKNDL